MHDAINKSLCRKIVKHDIRSSPPTGDRIEVAVGLEGSEDPADSGFRNLKGEVY